MCAIEFDDYDLFEVTSSVESDGYTFFVAEVDRQTPSRQEEAGRRRFFAPPLFSAQSIEAVTHKIELECVSNISKVLRTQTRKACEKFFGKAPDTEEFNFL